MPVSCDIRRLNKNDSIRTNVQVREMTYALPSCEGCFTRFNMLYQTAELGPVVHC